jgi:hypothetical protein
MTASMNSLVVHLTRGITNPTTVDGARELHNEFVARGTPPGIDIAQSLGDVSHAAYLPADPAPDASTPGELLFLDAWLDPEPMERFFADPLAKKAGERLYSSREESEWWPAPDAFSFHLPAPADSEEHFFTTMRAHVSSDRDAIAALSSLVRADLGTSRRRGHLSHGTFVRTGEAALARPASNARHHTTAHAVDGQVEVLTIDTWSTHDGLPDHYASLTPAIGTTACRRAHRSLDLAARPRLRPMVSDSNPGRPRRLSKQVDNHELVRKLK